MRNLLTVDVEDYYMVSAFADVVQFNQWGGYPSRVQENTLHLLNILESRKTIATFFIVGYVANKYPELVREIKSRGHEIGCHSNFHRSVFEMSPEDFRSDTRDAKAVLENLTGERVLGYRAPSYSITGKSLWALDILIEEGFAYDSSIFPIHHDLYGIPEFERFPVRIHRHGVGSIAEFPPSTFRIFGRNVPVAGGGYFRLYPMQITKWAIRRLNEIEGERALVYVHPWEIDIDQPRIQAGPLSRFRHYTNIDKTEGRIRTL
ncbi:MAG: DUF3473 domain-containing protein, partial [bacterium]|nr:DUF3473 domain-containing protein [bacterium]